MIHTPQLPRDFVDSRGMGSTNTMGKTMVLSNNRTNQNQLQQQQQQQNNMNNQTQQQRPMYVGVPKGVHPRVIPNPLTAQRVVVQKQMVQHGQPQREITVREAFAPQNGWKPTFNRPGTTQVQRAAGVSRGSIDRGGVMYVERPNQNSASRPINLHVQPTPLQRSILRQQQLIQHAQPVAQHPLNRSAAQYQKVTIEPPRTQQFQQPQQQRQVKSPNDLVNQQRPPVSAQMVRIQPNSTASFSRKRSAQTPPTPESVENFVYSPPSGTAPKRVKENTDWQPMPGLMPQQQPTIQKKPVVNSDGSLPDYVRNIAGFEIRVIRSKDPDMRLFPC